MAQAPPFTSAATVNAAGNATITFRPRANQINRVTQVAVEMPGATGALCAIRRNGALVAPVIASGDAAAGDPPIWLWPGDELTVEWTGAAAGLIGKATVFYSIGEG